MDASLKIEASGEQSGNFQIDVSGPFDDNGSGDAKLDLTAKGSGDIAGQSARLRGRGDLHRRRRLHQLAGHRLQAQLGAVLVPDQLTSVLEPERWPGPGEPPRPQGLPGRPHQRGRDRGRGDQHDPRLGQRRSGQAQRRDPLGDRAGRREAAPARPSSSSSRGRCPSSTRSPTRSRRPASTSTRGSTTTCCASSTSTSRWRRDGRRGQGDLRSHAQRRQRAADRLGAEQLGAVRQPAAGRSPRSSARSRGRFSPRPRAPAGGGGAPAARRRPGSGGGPTRRCWSACRTRRLRRRCRLAPRSSVALSATVTGPRGVAGNP